MMICLVLADIILDRFVLIYLLLMLSPSPRTYSQRNDKYFSWKHTHTHLECESENKKKEAKKTFRFHFYLTLAHSFPLSHALFFIFVLSRDFLSIFCCFFWCFFYMFAHAHEQWAHERWWRRRRRRKRRTVYVNICAYHLPQQSSTKS